MVSQPEWSETLDRPTLLWWVWVPLAWRRISPRIALSFLDGFYLVAWQRAAAVLPPLALVVGLVVGGAQVGFRTAFSESLPLIIFVAVLGTMSANLGGLFLLGFSVANFVFTHPTPPYYWGPRNDTWLLLLQAKSAQLIHYGLLAWLVVTVPQLTRGLIATIQPPATWSRQVQVALVVVGQAVLTGFAVHFWVQTVPILIRPLFTWVKSNPPVAAMAPLQAHGWVVVGAAAAAAVVRVLLQAKAASESDLAERVDAWDEQLVLAPAVNSVVDRVHPWGLVLLQGGWSTFMLAGMMHHWLDALAFGALLVALRAAQVGLIRVPLGPWPRLVAQVPSVVRLAAAFLVITYLARRIMAVVRYRVDTFRPILILTAVSLVILYLLHPNLSPEDGQGGS